MAKATAAARAAAEENPTNPVEASAPASAPVAEKAAPAVEAAVEDVMYVLDTTAVLDPTNPIPRIHSQLVNGVAYPFTFHPGKGLPLPRVVAVKFLQHDGFKLVDKDGKELVYKRPPKQADQLQAGEQLKIADDETIARYDELSNPALLRRVMALHGGEKFSEGAPSRAAIIKFIVDTKKKIAAANKSKEPDVKKDEFVPMADFDEEEAD